MSSPPQQLVFPLRPCHSSHAFLLSNCLSHHSQISPQSSLLVHPESKKGANDFVSRTSQLTLTLRSTHFTTGGQATLTCEATVPGVYRRMAKVYLSLPGYKTAAPSLKLYGTGSGLRGGATLVATCLVLLLL
ncbi:hypothetical protein E2C01_017352 [Portunus trituberculatus]|uniref:Uncharacterized protein n=1 Tax=Portunus trituberculatus TaxID=210409 RepID=A0A5B7DRE0_PORTR|nr:hypothetical protein [Portunus trituberculatus]